MQEQVFKAYMGTTQHLTLFYVCVFFACAYMYYIMWMFEEGIISPETRVIGSHELSSGH